jgi:hypothetical protein
MWHIQHRSFCDFIPVLSLAESFSERSSLFRIHRGRPLQASAVFGNHRTMRFRVAERVHTPPMNNGESPSRTQRVIDVPHYRAMGEALLLIIQTRWRARCGMRMETLGSALLEELPNPRLLRGFTRALGGASGPPL